MSNNSSCVAYLGALPFHWELETVKSVVCGSGPIVDVRLMMDSPTKNKGFAFIEYQTPQSAAQALTLLSKVRIDNRKKLRTELSKEGLRNLTGNVKPLLPLDRSFLPQNVTLPREMQQEPEGVMDDLDGPARVVHDKMMANPQLRSLVSSMLAQGMHLFEIQQQLDHQSMGSPQQQQQQPAQARQSLNEHLYSQSNGPAQQDVGGIPSNLLNASSLLALPTPEQSQSWSSNTPSNALANSLSAIPPGVLIELIAKLKMMLNQSSNFAEADAVLRGNRSLALAAAQALVLMGIVDLGVIEDVMKTATASSTASAAPAAPSHLPPQQGTWSPQTEAKLAQLPANERAMIEQILKLDDSQMNGLSGNERQLAMDIRQRYL